MLENCDVTYEELVHIIAFNIRQNNVFEALKLCKKNGSGEHPDQRINLMHAAILAQIGMTEDAILKYREVVDADKTNVIAKFQLGLLYFLKGDHTKAFAVWQDMGELTTIIDGFTALASEAFEDAIALFEKGISQNSQVVEINTDITNLIARLKDAHRQHDAGLEENSDVKDSRIDEDSSSSYSVTDPASILSIYQGENSR